MYGLWLDPVLFIKILLKTAQLFSKHFRPGLSLCILYFLSHKGKDTSVILQWSIHHLVNVFPIFFGVRSCFNNFHWSNILHYATHFSLKENNLRLSKRFLFILSDNHTEIGETIFSAIRNSVHACAVRDNIMQKRVRIN